MTSAANRNGIPPARSDERAAFTVTGTASRPVLICFSHLRWNFVYQRPQHLMSRMAREYRVLFFEEPVKADVATPMLEVREEPSGVHVLVPHLPHGVHGAAAEDAQRELLDRHLADHGIDAMALWYYTPMSLAYSDHVRRTIVVYDCMDELSAFRGAPSELLDRERRLLERADVVFTGGHSLFEAKRALHPNVHSFPSSVDVPHFAQAREPQGDPTDQAGIPHPRMGFYGVLDERLDVGLIERIADARPDWHLVLIGPVVKIDAASLAQRPNIHYLGGKRYEALPGYLAGWDVALMPFALNESTRFISPTKTPEYLAGGCPVVSTAIADVVRTYGETGVVHIAQTADGFVPAIETALAQAADAAAVCRLADRVLVGLSWDATWERMRGLMQQAAQAAAFAAAGPADGDARVRNPGHFMPGLSLVAGAGRLRRRAGGNDYDCMVVGAGFAGAVLAERLAAGSDKRVLVIDRRPHIGGNAYDYVNDDGILVHRYGPHIFHTNSAKVVEHLSRFTQWLPYEHRVLAAVDDKLVPMPINLTTLGMLYGHRFTPDEAAAFLAARAESVKTVRTSEDVVVGTVGRELYETFFRGYTRKQWGLDPSELDRSVTARVPTRTSEDDRYFTDTFQCMPLHGYTRMFESMLAHPNITVCTSTSFEDVRDEVQYEHLVYSGPIDTFFDYRYGKLPYRSLEFRHVTLDQEQFQPVGVVNYPDEQVPYTRITEYKHLTGQRHSKTSLTYEIPRAEGDPYYPVPRPENAELYRKYQALADQTSDVTFVGRLATYKYYNMDQVVAQALSLYERMAEEFATREGRQVPRKAATAGATVQVA